MNIVVCLCLNEVIFVDSETSAVTLMQKIS